MVSTSRSLLVFGFALSLGFLSTNGARAEVVEKKDIVYATRGDLALELDVAHPSIAKMPRPMVLCVHGGGWRGGKRQQYQGLIRDLAERGYVAASVTYRLTQVAPWPAQMDDVDDALRWFRAHAGEFGGDPARIGVMGHSAGGHLSLMLGTRSDREKQPATSVQAVVNFFGPTDMRNPAGWPAGSRSLIEHLGGGPYEGKRKKTFWDFSPVNHLSRGDAPVLTFHGTKDPIVPYAQATMFHREMSRLSVPGRLVTIEGQGHGWGGEQVERTNTATYAFFDRYLKGSELPLVAIEDFESGSERWELTDGKQWKVGGVEGRRHLSLVEKKGSYKPKVRSPYSIALLKDTTVGDFVLDVTLRSTIPEYNHRDLCLFFGHQGPSKFYYVHLGKKGDDHANSIFVVNDAARTTIARERTMGIDWDDAWHRVRVRRSVDDGLIEIFFDDMSHPVMCTNDKTFLHGRIGVGSFDDTGDFDEIRLRGKLIDP
jgi:acetyl esterase/lipase